jgi:hypothetical protein
VTVQDLSDGELYFVVSNGIRNSNAPLRARHNAKEIWRTILWVRHSAQLKAEERKEMGRETSDQEHLHEETMIRDRAGGD